MIHGDVRVKGESEGLKQSEGIKCWQFVELPQLQQVKGLRRPQDKSGVRLSCWRIFFLVFELNLAPAIAGREARQLRIRDTR